MNSLPPSLIYEHLLNEISTPKFIKFHVKTKFLSPRTSLYIVTKEAKNKKQNKTKHNITKQNKNMKVHALFGVFFLTTTGVKQNVLKTLV